MTHRPASPFGRNLLRILSMLKRRERAGANAAVAPSHNLKGITGSSLGEKAGSADPASDTRLVSALARGISILRCFSAMENKLGAREIMERTGLPKPTLFRLLETLCDLNLLRYSERTSKFQIGISMLGLATPALTRMPTRQLARPLMQELADHLQGQVHMSVGWRGELTYVEIAQGKENRMYKPEVGMHMSLSRTASGRSYLCSMPESERKAHLQKLVSRDPDRQDLLHQRLAETEKELATHGFCHGRRDLHQEVEVIASSALSTRDGEQIIFSAAVEVFSPFAQRLTEEVGPRLITLVRNVRAVVSGSADY